MPIHQDIQRLPQSRKDQWHSQQRDISQPDESYRSLEEGYFRKQEQYSQEPVNKQIHTSRPDWVIDPGKGVPSKTEKTVVFPSELTLKESYTGYSSVQIEQTGSAWQEAIHGRMLGWLSRGTCIMGYKERLNFVISYPGLLEDLKHTSVNYDERSNLIAKLMKEVPSLKLSMLWPITEQGYGMNILQRAMDEVGARQLIFCGEQGSELLNKGLGRIPILTQSKLFDDKFIYIIESVDAMLKETKKYEETLSFLKSRFKK